jgi:hypothetical protein
MDPNKQRHYLIPEEVVIRILFCGDGKPRWDNTAAKALRAALPPEEYEALLLKVAASPKKAGRTGTRALSNCPPPYSKR